MSEIVIRSGGQTGVDRAALRVAVRRGLLYLGWCPQGGWAEDCPEPPGIRLQFPRLVETPSADPRQRTAWNVRDSHATLILTSEDGLLRSPGTRFTQTMAELVFVRPLLIVRAADLDAVPRVVEWLGDLQRRFAESTLVVNFAGPRESTAPGIGDLSERFIERLLDEMANA